MGSIAISTLRTQFLPPEESRIKDWPACCMESWLKSFIRWEESGEQYTMSVNCISAMRHNLECNLLYIRELEAKCQKS